MKVQLGIDVPSDVERVLNAFGRKLVLGRPATPEEVHDDLAKYIQQTVQMQEQSAASSAAAQIPPVSINGDKPE